MAAKKKATKKVATKKAAVKKHYIVTFDIDDSDPVQVFDSLDKAKEFVTALLRKDDDEIYNVIGSYDWSSDEVEAASVKVYEGILIGKPKIEITFDK